MNRTSQQLSRFSTQIPQAAPKRIAASFKPGPFRGALLASEPRQDHDQQPQHDYSASQLLRAARTTPSSSSASPPATTTLHFPHSRLIRQHLDELLYPLTFSDQLACRIVSSKNLLKSQHALDALEHHAPGGVGFARLGEHNSKLSFIGRRAMHFALSNFLLHAPRPPTPPPSPSSDPHHHRYRSGRPTSEVIEDALLTKFVLGQYVGHQWELEKIMRWRELAPPPTQAPPTKALNGTGLWMARGHVVEAIVGAVMAEHGARLSIAVFHSLVLPHLSFRLDPALLPAIKAVQTHDHELESPAAGLVDWKSLRIEPFLANNPAQQPASAELSTPAPVAAVG